MAGALGRRAPRRAKALRSRAPSRAGASQDAPKHPSRSSHAAHTSPASRAKRPIPPPPFTHTLDVSGRHYTWLNEATRTAPGAGIVICTAASAVPHPGCTQAYSSPLLSSHTRLISTGLLPRATDLHWSLAPCPNLLPCSMARAARENFAEICATTGFDRQQP